jgi:hypothetical protein
LGQGLGDHGYKVGYVGVKPKPNAKVGLSKPLVNSSYSRPSPVIHVTRDFKRGPGGHLGLVPPKAQDKVVKIEKSYGSWALEFGEPWPGLGHNGYYLGSTHSNDSEACINCCGGAPLLTLGEGRGICLAGVSGVIFGSVSGPSGAVTWLPVLVEGSKAGFAELAGGVAEPLRCSQIALDVADSYGLKVSLVEALLQPLAQPPSKAVGVVTSLANQCVGPCGVEASGGVVVSQAVSLGIAANSSGPLVGCLPGPQVGCWVESLDAGACVSGLVGVVFQDMLMLSGLLLSIRGVLLLHRSLFPLFQIFLYL